MAHEGSKYYGAFFWLSLVSFVVPVFVAAFAFQSAARPHTKPEPQPDASGVDHGLWDYLLKRYVVNGLVDYAGLERDHLFFDYLEQLGAAEPGALTSSNERLALLCNAYNAFTIHGVIRHDIADTVDGFAVEGTGFFDLREHIYAGETMSLNHLEHQIIRAEYDEPRIHFALVCAARSCPPLRTEAYTGKQLEAQLADQTRLFANGPKYVEYDAGTNTLKLSAILRWYGQDFENQGGYLEYLREYVNSQAMKDALAKAKAGEADIRFKTYDWSLNAQEGTASATPSKSGGGEFGSGAIPNE